LSFFCCCSNEKYQKIIIGIKKINKKQPAINKRKKKCIISLGFNGISTHSAPVQSTQSTAFVSESNFSSVFGNTEPVGM
jgi:hypothetical protein